MNTTRVVRANSWVDDAIDVSFASLEPGQVHELLTDDGVPRRVAAWLGQNAKSRGVIVWCDPSAELYPPALVTAGLLPLYRVRPRNHAEMIWAMTEALRCRGVGVTIGAPMRLTTVEARRLQLAAERGGGIGILMRSPQEKLHAARTRWLVRPAHGDPLVQRWRLQLIHGHGRPANQEILLEVNRETHHVCAIDSMADRSREATPIRTAG